MLMSELKKFVKGNLINDNHPLMYMIFYGLRTRLHKRNKNLTYQEIEDIISRQYYKTFKRELNWNNPQTYNEKIHVSKLYMTSPSKTMLADKVEVRNWIREKIGDEYLIPLLGVYEKFGDIDFHTLPNKFVIKCNHDSGSVTRVNDKSKIDIKLLRGKYKLFMLRNYAWRGFEMHYRDIKPKIIIEQHIGDSINDYKFMCFDGKPCYCWVDMDRFTNHTRNFYNLDWKREDFSKLYPNSPKDAQRPERFDEMLEIAGKLCGDFDQVRVDLYCTGNKIYFGEMTFSDGNGYEKFIPDEWDYKLGALWPFDNTIRERIRAEKLKP